MTKPIVRDHLVKVRVTEDECEKLIKAAERKGLPVSSWLRMVALAAALAGCGGILPADKLEAQPQADAADHVADASKMIDAADGRDLESMPVDMSTEPDLAHAPDLAPMCTPDLAACVKDTDCCVHPGLGLQSEQNVYASCDLVTNTCVTTWDLYNCPRGGYQNCHSSTQGDLCSGC